MPDDDAFLATILDNPDDDGPRLVYADWLEENGQCERAEFIRVQCELASPSPQNHRRDWWSERESELLRANQKPWLAPLLSELEERRHRQPPPPLGLPFVQFVQQLFGASAFRRIEEPFSLDSGPSREWLEAMLGLIVDPRSRLPIESQFRCVFRRGFVERIELTAADFAAYAPLLFQRVPLRELVVIDGPLSRGFVDFFNQPLLQRIHTLELLGALTHERFQAFQNCPYLENLQRLNLERATIGADDAVRICESMRMPNLRELRLNAIPVRLDGAAALARNSAWSRLEVLGLAQTELTDAGVDALIQSPHLHHLRRLDLSHNQLTGAAVIALVNATSLPSLIHLNLAHNRLAGSNSQELSRLVGLLMHGRILHQWMQRLIDSPLGNRLQTLVFDTAGFRKPDRVALTKHFGSRLRWA